MSRELQNEEKNNAPNNVNEDEEEHVSAGILAHEALSVSGKVINRLFVEEAASCEPEEGSGPTTSKELDVDMNKTNEHLQSDHDGPSGINFQTPDKEPICPAQEEDEEEVPAALADKEEHKGLVQLLENQEREEAHQLNQQLQMKLAGYFQRRANKDVHQEWSASGQHEYEKHLQALTDLKLQLRSASESAQRQAEELEMLAQEKMDQVEKDWQALVALKQDAAEAALSRRLGKEAARAKVKSVLVAAQIRQDELTKVRLKHFKLKLKVHRLEAELRERNKDSRDPLQVRFEQLWAERLKQKQQAEKENEESLKLQKKISCCLELLSNIKEKLFWGQMEVQSRRQQLAEVEAMVATKKDLLSQTRQDRTRVQRDNLRLKEQCGLLGNRVLLQDFEDTVDASEQLEKHLETLKVQQAETVFKCEQWRKKMETTFINQ
nr:coiled-coil domain-containing protein 96 [Nothobranchius furzeri]